LALSVRTTMKLFRQYTFVDYATQGYFLFVGLLILLFHNDKLRAWGWLTVAHAIGILLVHALLWLHARKPAAEPLNLLRHLYPILLYVFFFAETGWLNRMFVRDFQDPMVIRWEQALFGGQPGVTFMQRFPHLWFSEILYAAYFSYYLMIVGVGVLLFGKNRQGLFQYLSVLSFVFYVCYTTYIFLPVAGPRLFLDQFPEYRLPAELYALAPGAYYPVAVQSGPFFLLMRFIYDVFESPGATFPSSHVAAALCTLYFSYRFLPRVFPLHAVLVVLLCLSTVYGRYHYAVDVLAGLLTAGVLVPFGNFLYFRIAPEVLPNGSEVKVPVG
jgi:membrane-associated phospholipid phosphatase